MIHCCLALWSAEVLFHPHLWHFSFEVRKLRWETWACAWCGAGCVTFCSEDVIKHCTLAAALSQQEKWSLEVLLILHYSCSSLFTDMSCAHFILLQRFPSELTFLIQPTISFPCVNELKRSLPASHFISRSPTPPLFPPPQPLLSLRSNCSC